MYKYLIESKTKMVGGGLNNSLFGPLGKNYCVLFYWLSLFSIIMLVFTILAGLYFAMKTKIGAPYYMNLVIMGVMYVLTYYQNRLFYTMCNRSL